MKSILLLLAVPVVALTGCSTYVGDAGPGYYDNGYYAGGPYYNPGPTVEVGFVGYDRGGGYYHHDYHHTDNAYRGSTVVAASHTNSFHAASNTRVASSNVSHSSGHSGGGRTASASASAGHEGGHR